MKGRTKRNLMVGATLIALAILSISFVIAGGKRGNTVQTSVVMQTVPIEAEWVADGVNTYRMDVRFDASSYPEAIVGLEWRINFPDYIVFDSSTFPPEEEFFFGNLPLDPFTDLAWQVTDTSVSGRVLLLNTPDSPIGANGTAAQYWFTVDPGATPGQHTFDVPFVSITISDPSGTLCPPFPICSGFVESVENLPFTIISLACTGDIITDGTVDVLDLLEMLANWGSNPANPDADLNADGVVDVLDLLDLLANWGSCGLAGHGDDGGHGDKPGKLKIPSDAKKILNKEFGKKFVKGLTGY